MSRCLRSPVEAGSIAYSAVTQPLPRPCIQRGTESLTEAVQITRVLPIEISAEPSARGDESRVDRRPAGCRPGRGRSCGRLASRESFTRARTAPRGEPASAYTARGMRHAQAQRWREVGVEGERLVAAVALDQREGGGVDVAPALVVVALEDLPGVVPRRPRRDGPARSRRWPGSAAPTRSPRRARPGPAAPCRSRRRRSWR